MRYPSIDTLSRVKLTMEIVTPFVVLAILLLVATNLPGIVRTFVADMSAAGLHPTKVSALGVEADVSEVPATLQAAQGAIISQDNLIAAVRKNLECAPDCSKDQVQGLKDLVSNSTVTQGANATLAQTRTVAAKLDQAAPTPPPASGAASWVAVISADSNRPQADYEVDRAKKHYPGPVELVRRGNWLRTVIHFASEADAKAAMPAIETMTGRTPYVRDLSTWCPDPTKGPDGLLVCGAVSGGD